MRKLSSLEDRVLVHGLAILHSLYEGILNNHAMFQYHADLRENGHKTTVDLTERPSRTTTTTFGLLGRGGFRGPSTTEPTLLQGA